MRVIFDEDGYEEGLEFNVLDCVMGAIFAIALLALLVFSLMAPFVLAAHAEEWTPYKSAPKSLNIEDVQPLLPRSATDGSLINGLQPYPSDTKAVLRTRPPTVVHYDEGGRIADYDQRWREIAMYGGQVEIRGMCFSACTLVAAHVPKERLCFAGHASLKFHQARHGIPDDRPNPDATQWMINQYPQDIKAWIIARGGRAGMPRHEYWTLTAPELWQMGYRKCSD